MLLEREGCDVIQASSAGGGIARPAEPVPDLILVDLALPAMDGRGARRRLKSRAGTARIPGPAKR